MANTYINIKLHVIFAVKNRESLVPTLLLPHLHAYIAKSLNQRGHRAIAVGGTNNHIHILFSYSGKELISDIVREIKVAVTNRINHQHLIPYKFEWQRGYACFSVSSTNVGSVKNYIQNQFEHHKGKSLQDEIKGMLDLSGTEYDDRYIFDNI